MMNAFPPSISIQDIQLPIQSRVWVYPFPQTLTEDQLEWVTKHSSSFVADWKAHGKALDAHFAIIENCFLLLAVNEDSHLASGCSIDDSMAFIRQLGSALGGDMTDRSRVFFRRKDNGQIDELPFQQCATKARNGELSVYGSVFDFSADRWGKFQLSFERPLEDSFLARFLPK